VEARAGFSHDPRENVALQFARKLVALRGSVGEEDVERLRAEGFTDAEVVDIVALVGLNLFTITVGLATRPDVDFPLVEPGLAAAA
jgi:alkylhydroperoxidase family enzyme